MQINLSSEDIEILLRKQRMIPEGYIIRYISGKKGVYGGFQIFLERSKS